MHVAAVVDVNIKITTDDHRTAVRGQPFEHKVPVAGRYETAKILKGRNDV